MSIRWTGLFWLFSLSLFSQGATAQMLATPGKQTAHQLTFEVIDEETNLAAEVDVPFLLYLPSDYQRAMAPVPLVLFLHGLGESGAGGDELAKVERHGPPKLVAQGKDFPFVLVSPQVPSPGSKFFLSTAWRPAVLHKLLDQITRELNIDERRVYVTGISMGGFGTWRLGASRPERFAALAPICGGGLPDRMAQPLAKLPIWAFHGARDKIVEPQFSQHMVDAVKAAGGDVRLTIYPEAEHDSWTATYNDPQFYEWLLSQRRTERPAARNK